MLKKNSILTNKKNFKFIKFINKVIVFHIFSTFNNTIITLTNNSGDTIFWLSSASAGYKGHKKSTFYAAQSAAEKVGKTAVNLGFKKSKIFVKGFGIGRDYAIRGIFSSGINVLSVTDITSIPHNGCKFKKMKRN